jgi:hypothetical protein
MSDFKHRAMSFGATLVLPPDVGSSIGPISLHNAIGRFVFTTKAPLRQGCRFRFQDARHLAQHPRVPGRKRAEWDGLVVSPRYKFRNEALIEWLEITPEEERQLKTIISGDERRRDNERDAKRSREAFMPLFTGVRGIRILGSSLSACCKSRP